MISENERLWLALRDAMRDRDHNAELLASARAENIRLKYQITQLELALKAAPFG